MTFDNKFDVTKTQICLIMYNSHLVKKIRNNITKSGTLTTHKRYMKLGKKIHCVGALVQGLSMRLPIKYSESIPAAYSGSFLFKLTT